MPEPIGLTFETLVFTDNAYALDVLTAALDVPDNNICLAAVKSILKRRSSRGHLELIRRYHRFNSEMQELFGSYAGMMNKSLRQSLLSEDIQIQKNALELIHGLEMYDLFPVVLEMLADEKQGEHHRYCLEIVDDLVTKIYEHAHHTSKEKKYLRDAQMIQLRMVSALEKACGNPLIPGYGQILENLMVLGDLGSNVIRKLLRQDGHPHHRQAEDLLLHCDHPGILQLIVDFMGLSHASALAFRCISRRNDPQFINHLLRQWPRSLSISQRKNYKQIESVCWLEEQPLQLEIIPPALHVKLLNFVYATSLPKTHKLHTVEWIVSHGCEEARRIATELLEELDKGRMQTLIVDGLDSDDEEVQAWATSQLRTRKVPEAFAELIERLDSPLSQVQQAARNELEDFNLKRILSLYDLLDPQTCRLAGALILKIDPETLDELSVEMTGPMRSKRMRAMQAAIAMGLEKPLLETFLALLEDEDVLIRRTAVEAVSQIPGVESQQALMVMTEDSNPRIREIAAKGIQTLQTEAASSEPGLSELR